MGAKKNNRAIDTKGTQKVTMEIPSVHSEGLQYYNDIRASWVSNQKHCEPNDKRGYYKRGIKFCDEWQGALGWMRYYVFHMDNEYVKGESKLVRIDTNKGFSPSNCRIDKITKKKKEEPTKSKGKKVQHTIDSSVDNTISPNINNQIIILPVSDTMRTQDIIEVLMSRGKLSTANIDSENNKIIYLKSITGIGGK